MHAHRYAVTFRIGGPKSTTRGPLMGGTTNCAAQHVQQVSVSGCASIQLHPGCIPFWAVQRRAAGRQRERQSQCTGLQELPPFSAAQSHFQP